MLMMFMFFLLTGGAGAGLMAFSVVAVIAIYGTDLVTANATLTGHLFASAMGVLVGGWLADRLDTLGADVRTRFRHAASVDKADADAAYDAVVSARARLRDLIGDRVLVLPSSSSVAPLLGQGLQAVRDATMRLTCVAGLAGAPAVSLPLATRAGLPCGVSLVAAPGRDRALLDLAVSLG